MLLETETQRMLNLLAELSMPGLLLKGYAIAHWAYPYPFRRASGDIDVLVATGADAAGQATREH